MHDLIEGVLGGLFAFGLAVEYLGVKRAAFLVLWMAGFFFLTCSTESPIVALCGLTLTAWACYRHLTPTTTARPPPAAQATRPIASPTPSPEKPLDN